MLAEYLDQRGARAGQQRSWQGGGGWQGGMNSQMPADSIGTPVPQPTTYGGSPGGIYSRGMVSAPTSSLTDMVARQRMMTNSRAGVMQSPGTPDQTQMWAQPRQTFASGMDSRMPVPGVSSPLSSFLSARPQPTMSAADFARDYASPTADELAGYQNGTLGQTQVRPQAPQIQRYQAPTAPTSFRQSMPSPTMQSVSRPMPYQR